MNVTVTCPWCFEAIELWVDPEVSGAYVEDCEVCCRPWSVHVERGDHGELTVSVERAA